MRKVAKVMYEKRHHGIMPGLCVCERVSVLLLRGTRLEGFSPQRALKTGLLDFGQPGTVPFCGRRNTYVCCRPRQVRTKALAAYASQTSILVSRYGQSSNIHSLECPIRSPPQRKSTKSAIRSRTPQNAPSHPLFGISLSVSI